MKKNSAAEIVGRKDRVEARSQPILLPNLPPTSRLKLVREQSLSFLKGIALFVTLVLFLKCTVVEAFFVPTNSMAPTVQPHDYILVPKFFYGLRLPFIPGTLVNWRSPQKGEIVVFHREDDLTTHSDEANDIFVKRVIAVAGEVVEVIGTKVYINGVALPEPYAVWSHEGKLVSEGHWGPEVVPDNSIFVLGDNRDESRDSRLWLNPYVKVKSIQGRAAMIYWSSANPVRSGRSL